MPFTLKDIKTGQEPESARRVREFLAKNVKPEAPYFNTEELLKLAKLNDTTLRSTAKPRLKEWHKKVGRWVYWSTPEHIKKL